MLPNPKENNIVKMIFMKMQKMIYIKVLVQNQKPAHLTYSALLVMIQLKILQLVL